MIASMNWLPDTWEQVAGLFVALGSIGGAVLWTGHKISALTKAVLRINTLVPVAPVLATVPATLETIQATATATLGRVCSLEGRVVRIEAEVSYNGGGSLKDEVKRIAAQAHKNNEDAAAQFKKQNEKLEAMYVQHNGHVDKLVSEAKSGAWAAGVLEERRTHKD